MVIMVLNMVETMISMVYVNGENATDFTKQYDIYQK